MPIATRVAAALCLAATASLGAQQGSGPAGSWWPAGVSRALARSGDNRAELEKALRAAPEAHREAIGFLVEHMPAGDLKSLRSEFLLDNVALAIGVLGQVPWGERIPREVFLNDVLPYANVSETRESWRKGFRDRFLPLVSGCKTPGEAAQVLNRRIFDLLGVRYSTGRRRADQSPAESIEQGVASCTGLSILLVDACRAVGVPARLAGIPQWVNKRGNHTWVEVWDGTWHFTGAAEPSKAGLNHTWFQRDAALAIAGDPRHGIYAVSYRKTDTRFPMVWSRRADPVSAVDVTARYTKDKPTAQGRSRLMIRVRSRPGGPRVKAAVAIAPRAQPDRVQRGESRDEGSDTNDFLGFDIDPKLVYLIRVTGMGREREILHRPNGGDEELLEVLLVRGEDEVQRAAAAWFAAAPEKRDAVELPDRLDRLLMEDESAARLAVWRAYQAAPLHDGMRADFAQGLVRSAEHTSPYTVKEVGRRPAGGWPLFIAMHGGGGVAKRVNDSQWQHMQVYYRDQASVEGYKYVALRAPNDTWNGFYDHYVWPLVARLVRQFTLCGDVDPDRVFLMGYSHGGYGAFAIGANIPDRFAAVHASAAAPTPGITPAEHLRNLVFTFMIGERDTRYGRRDRCVAFDAAIRGLRGDREGIFPVTMELQTGRGHGGLPDRDKIVGMYPARRRSAPRELTWRPTGGAVNRFYWLSVPAAQAGQEIDARCADNVITLRARGTGTVTLGLDRRLVDFARPVVVRIRAGAATVEHRHSLAPSLRILCASMLGRGDPGLACTARLVVGFAE